MMAGIVVSGAYAKSQRVTLPVGVPTKVGDSTLTFVRVVPGAPDLKQMMEVRVETARGRTFYAYPKMYENGRTGQLMANPSIDNSPVMDLYIAPQQYDPGQPQVNGRDERLTRGTTTNIEGTGFTFRDFSADRSAMMRGERTILVLTDLTITPPDGSKYDLTLHYKFNMETQEADAEQVNIPGIPGGTIAVLAVSPNDGAVVVRLTGVSKNPRDEFQPATVESLSVDVTWKPLIALVWGGFYVMMAGGLLAFLRRSREARKAVLEGSPGLVHQTPPVASTGPALPAHTRSPLRP